MLNFLFLNLHKNRSKAEAAIVQSESSFELPLHLSRSQRRVLLGAALAAIAAPLAWYGFQVATRDTPAAIGWSTAIAVAEAQRERHRSIAAPSGWNQLQVADGVTAYLAPQPEIATVLPALPGAAIASTPLDPRDGTRHPYRSEITLADLKANPIAPGRYLWQSTWEGEGYGRILDPQGQLVSPREPGADIHLSILLDTTITDPTQPNLTITLQSDQDKTGQLTNISAFRIDPNTGATIERQDFAQLPPLYHVTLSRNHGFKGSETKPLKRLETIAFTYHIPIDQLADHLPLQLEAINQQFEERLQEFANLEAAGWIVKEFPAPQP